MTDTPTSPRLVSIDVFRGTVMLMMLAHVLAFCQVAEARPDSRFWQWLCFHWSHVPWRGLSLHDLIQPGFSFLVGTALAFSLASRQRRGQSTRSLIGHVVYRSVVLILLGVFLRSMGKSQTNWTFEDTLTQIGLGYLPLVLVGLWADHNKQLAKVWLVIVLLLAGYWGAFAAYPAAGPDFDYAAVGVAEDWPHHQDGLAAHWNKNSNLAWRFDVWFMNLFPRQQPFEFNRGGYATLSFIPTLATMLLGFVAGCWLRDLPTGAARIHRLSVAAMVCLVIGYGLDLSGICPNVKRIWTPAWVLVSGGWCLAILAALHAVCDCAGYRRWAFPLAVIGMNSIVAYVMDWTFVKFVGNALETHLGENWAAQVVGPAYATLLSGSVILLVVYGVLRWMHARRLFVKI